MKEKRNIERYIHKDIWYAWFPVKTISGEWIWLKYVKRTIDERPLIFNGLLEEYTYEKLK